MPFVYDDNTLLNLVLRYRNDPDVIDMIEEIKRLHRVERDLNDIVKTLEDERQDA